MQTDVKTVCKIVIPVWLLLILCSCADTKNLTYFNNITKDTTLLNASQVPVSLINSFDILKISITSLNTQASNVFNNVNESSSGILVDSVGYLQLPLLGNIKAAGLSIYQLKENITRQLIQKELLIDPIVTIHFANYKVTVLGEVSRPTVINVPNEKLSILEAIGLAGDLTVYGKRNTVLIIRESGNGQKTFKRLNLNSKDIFTSPFYYLKSNDVVYVEPNKSKVTSISRAPQIISYILSALSLGLLIVQLLK